MSSYYVIPPVSQLVDGQFFQVPGPDGILTGYQYDKETKTLFQKESQIVIPSGHGITHIGDDPVPDATCDSPGLLAADDKCKLDSLVQMRLGVLGYQGAGFPDDGGFIVGDAILAAGSEFISLERIGNVIRFTVDSPIPLNCSCETCAQIYWIQDESEARAIRPPSCNGIMPDICGYGEIKIYTFPESVIVDPKDPLKALALKGNYPAFIFKRYDNAITPFENQLDLVLKRNTNGTSNVGWAFTPGTFNIAECVWFTGKDNTGAQIKFELWSESTPGILGQVLYRGNLITKQMAVITGYTQDVLTTNQYILKIWDVKNAAVLGSSFTATNVWRYQNPESTTTSVNYPKRLVKDATIDLLPVGTLVDLWQYEISRTSSQRTTRSFFSKQPPTDPANIWLKSAAVQFGDLFTAREEVNPTENTALTASEINVPDVRLFEPTIWGCNNLEDRFILSDDGGAAEDSDGNIVYEPSGEPINNRMVADIDPTIPGLRVLEMVQSLTGDINQDGVVDDADLLAFMCAYNSRIGDSNYNAAADLNGDGVVDIRDLALLGQQFDLNVQKITDRPVFLWHRGTHGNAVTHLKIAMPDSADATFPPYDLLLSAPVDHFSDDYMKVIKRGVFVTGPFAGAPFIVVKGIKWNDVPTEGTLRILTGAFRDVVWRYFFKAAFSPYDNDGVTLIGRNEVFPFDEDFPITQNPTDCASYCRGDAGSLGGSFCDFTAITSGTATDVPTNTTVVELLKQDYSSPCVRFQFGVNRLTGSESVTLQLYVGTLDMSVPYELHSGASEDDLVRGFAPGYTVSGHYTQTGFITDGIGDNVTSSPSGFKCYTGGELAVPVNGLTEKWNEVDVMFRGNQVWVWWNGLLISPDTTLSAGLPTPVAVTSQYFPINPQIRIGKIALRMFPGAIVRSMEISDQAAGFNEFTYSSSQATS